MLTYLYRSTLLLCLLSLNGCTVIAIADAAVSTTVKVGSAVVGTAVDVTRAGVRAITPGTRDKADDDGNNAATDSNDSSDSSDKDDAGNRHRSTHA
ncbi:hypothetical protein H8L32_18410 [Undibacterium sp. CY18W]|uniref:Lipoprotein n=1 Tax=Undibacterium hunanense TaxID=2762292 RepID=A0ABR6ZV19_9BURK|nr:hypothetical protein [Undibacterium hunanense]MBC3919469.1 hypothetical protein [Undibacterium hunanense]